MKIRLLARHAPGRHHLQILSVFRQETRRELPPRCDDWSRSTWGDPSYCPISVQSYLCWLRLHTFQILSVFRQETRRELPPRCDDWSRSTWGDPSYCPISVQSYLCWLRLHTFHRATRRLH